MEEYMRSRKSTGHGQSPYPVSAKTMQSPLRDSPDFERQSVPFHPQPDISPSTSASRVRSSEGHVSFSPLTNHSYSFPNDSQIREGRVKGWRQSLPGFFETASSHVPSLPYNKATSLGGLSPASSRLNFPMVRRLRRRADESDEGSHSLPGSLSEDQNDSGTDARRRARQGREPRAPVNFDSQPAPQSTLELNNPTENYDPQIATAPDLECAEAPQGPAVEPQGESNSKKSGEVPVWRSYRSVSLPFSNPISSRPHLEYEERNLETEYDLRSRYGVQRFP